jgi:hypothetical protein
MILKGRLVNNFYSCYLKDTRFFSAKDASGLFFPFFMTFILLALFPNEFESFIFLSIKIKLIKLF